MVRELQRFAQETNVLYEVVSMFADDVGRTDVPIGLLYLIDELIHDLLPSGADPLLHLNHANMYSTWSIFHRIPSILEPNMYPEPHPVAFNVPGLDPVNALFAPILAHEVGHTCWQRGLGQKLQATLDAVAVEAQLQIAVQAGVPPSLVMEQFASWLQELMCDALAATLTGPSFLFASTVFLPAVGQAVLGTHPYPRDRVAFTLRLLDRYSWTPLLKDLVGDVFDWCSDLAASPDLTNTPLESALRGAIRIAEPAIMELAERTAGSQVTAMQMFTAREDLFAHLDLEIPPVATVGNPISAWLLISAGWIHEIRQRAEEGPAALPSIAVDPRLNRFLLKAVELSGIVRLWGADDATAS
jgi:hypothetical protein